MTLDPRAIAELERLLVKATPGPWERSDDEPSDVVVWGADGSLVANVEGDDPERAGANGKLIATMRNLLPDLLRERRELRARLLDERAQTYTVFAIDLSSLRAARLCRHWAEAIRAGRIK